MVSADRMLTVGLHGFRAPSDLLWCTDSVHLHAVNLHGLGCRLSTPNGARVSCRLTCTASEHHWTTKPTYVGTGQPIPPCTCVHGGPNTLPQPAYVVTQIGDSAVTQRPRARNRRCTPA